MTDATTHRIFPNVSIGPEHAIGDFCLIGHPPRGAAPGDLPNGKVVVGPAGQQIKGMEELRCRSGLMRHPYREDASGAALP